MGEQYFKYGETIGPPTAEDVIRDPDNAQHYTLAQREAALESIKPKIDAIKEQMARQVALDRLLIALAKRSIEDGMDYLVGTVPPEKTDWYYQRAREQIQENEGEDNE